MRNWIAGLAALLTLSAQATGAEAQVYRFNPASVGASSSSSAAFYYYGLVGAEYARDSGLDFGFGLANLTLGFAPLAYGSLPGMGFEFGAFGYATDSFGQDGTGFASVYWLLAGGRLHLGAPRSAVDGINDTPVPGGNLYGRLQLGINMGLLPYSTWLAMAYNRPFVGLRYDRQAGALAYAVSAMQMRYASETVTNIALAFVRTGASGRVFGTLDHYRFATYGLTLAAIGGSMRFGGSSSSFWPMVVGGLWSVEHSPFGTQHTLSAYTTAQVTDRLGVTASVVHGLGYAQTLIGLSAAYALSRGCMLRAGVQHARVGGDTLWSLGILRAI